MRSPLSRRRDAAADASGVARSREPLRTPTPPGEGPTYRHLGQLVGFVMRLGTREVWDDAAALPPQGEGVLVVANHVSYLDVLAVGRYLIWSGRWPRYLGKAELWNVWPIGWLGRRCRQIPIDRYTSRAKDGLANARAALEAGECVAIYPEGGRTRDPELWPQRGRTGVARLALATGVPVIPVGHWGTHEVMPGRRLTVPRIVPKRKVRVVMGDPVPLDDLIGRQDDAAALREATDRIMEAITALVEDLRREVRPAAGVWDGTKGRRHSPS
ncbi:lysophospholipid acyltransferase family protein [Propioniciclava soli]|uniref:lysophospholipid acyltransferase family protein n=1 Tax=Propioniciclava soli TaxID=2775081 RepID=UPI001E5CC4AB